MNSTTVCDTLRFVSVSLIFPSGDRFSGATASDALRALAKTQWTDDARQDIKRALAWRYFVMSGGTDMSIHEFMDDDQFIDALHDAGFLQVERGSS